MRVWHRLFCAEDDGFIFPADEVAKLVGQRPEYDMGGGRRERLEIHAAEIRGGWVQVLVDLPDEPSILARYGPI